MTISQVEPLSRLMSTVYSTISNTIAHWSFYIPTHFSMSKRRRTRWKGVPVIYYGDDIYTVNHTHFIYTLRHSIAVAYVCCLGVTVLCVTVKLIV